MDFKRLLLYLALAIVGVLLWNTWMRDYPPTAVKRAEQQTQQAKAKTFAPPTFDPSAKTDQVQTHANKIPSIVAENGKLITVDTDVLHVKINTTGGSIVSAKLPKYPVSLKEKDVPIQILNYNPDQLYVAQTGLTNVGKPKIKYTAEKTSYKLEPGQKELVVNLKGRTENGLDVIKTFTFKPGKYSINVKYDVKNASAKPWSGSVFNQITRREVKTKSALHVRSYNGASISSPEKPYEKLTYKDLAKSNVSRNIKGGWIAMQQQYFLSAWVPNKDETNHYFSHVTVPPGSTGKNDIYTVGYVNPALKLKPGQSGTSSSTFYVGPEVEKNLESLAKGLDLTIDYGWLWFISKFLFWVMQHINNVVGNWGWTIVITTLLIKILFYWFSDKSYKSMVKMREVQPRMEALKERYGDDKQALTKATMELYKKEKVNPMGGCLPMLIQIPVFFALYYVLIEAVQLRQAPFILWIHDLSVKDPYYILPLLMGASMFIQQKLSPPPPDPTQAKVMMFLPLIFTVFFLTFPAGLVLYWLTNNVLSIAQQWYVMKTYKPKKEKAKKKKKLRK